MATLLHLSINSTSASATSGYQVLFIGLAALSQGFINGDVNVTDTSFFLIYCTFFGGLITLGIIKFLKNKDQFKVSKILILIILTLCTLSVVMVIPSAINSYI
jgi:hypothetical protein